MMLAEIVHRKINPNSDHVSILVRSILPYSWGKFHPTLLWVNHGLNKVGMFFSSGGSRPRYLEKSFYYKNLRLFIKLFSALLCPAVCCLMVLARILHFNITSVFQNWRSSKWYMPGNFVIFKRGLFKALPSEFYFYFIGITVSPSYS